MMLPCGNSKQLLPIYPIQLDLPKHRIQQWCDSLCCCHRLRIQSQQYDPHPLGEQRSTDVYGYVFEAMISMYVSTTPYKTHWGHLCYLLWHKTWRAWPTFLDWIEWYEFLSQIRSAQVLYHQACQRKTIWFIDKYPLLPMYSVRVFLPFQTWIETSLSWHHRRFVNGVPSV
jgi:hypothetical protein